MPLAIGDILAEPIVERDDLRSRFEQEVCAVAGLGK